MCVCVCVRVCVCVCAFVRLCAFRWRSGPTHSVAGKQDLVHSSVDATPVGAFGFVFGRPSCSGLKGNTYHGFWMHQCLTVNVGVDVNMTLNVDCECDCEC